MKIVKKLKYVDDIEVAIEIVKQLKTPKDIREEILEKKLKPSKKKSAFQKIMEIIDDLSEKSKIGFTESEFKSKLSNLGMNDDKMVELFNRLINEGYIYQKSIGHFKKVGD
jgi:DNA replicative helicase MCM subunit Mcm2 (Cdc46/Mcm family)